MADEEDQQVENVFDTLVSITDISGYLRKYLKQDILQSVSTLRKLFAKMKTQLENKNKENKKLNEEVMKVTEEMERTSGSHAVRQVAPSLDHMQHTYSGEARQMLPSEDRRRKLFTEVLKDDGGKRYRITLKAKNNSQSTEQIKSQMKDINPTDIKVGIKALKTLRDGRILIKRGSEE